MFERILQMSHHILRRITNVSLAFVVAVMSVNLSGVLTVAAANAATGPVANPTLSQACGLDIALVIDNSQSIDATELTSMKNALKGFTSALSGTPTQFSVTRFNNSATVLQSFTGDVTTVNTKIDSVPLADLFTIGTNWKDAFIAANGTFDPRPSNPNLIIFATDGNPNLPNGLGLFVNQADVDAAAAQADIAKNAGTRVLALGIGNDLSVDNLKAISGPAANTGDVLTSDVITTDFDDLAAQLATFADQTCGGTITTRKIIDVDGDPATTNDQTPASGWSFDINGGSNPDATTTDENGLTPPVKVTTPAGYSVNETAQSGYHLVSASCMGASNNGSLSGNAVTGIQVTAHNIVTCTFINTPNKASISGVKWNDANGNGKRGKHEETLSGWTIQLSQGGTVLATTTTDKDGSYSFDNLLAGTYTVCEVQQDGWLQTAPADNNGCYTIVVDGSGDSITDKDFGNRHKKTITATPATIKKDACGTKNDRYIIPKTKGVVYKVNGVEKNAGTYTVDGSSVTITAEPESELYILTGTTLWTLEFTNKSCPDITATAECNILGVAITLTNDGDTNGFAWVNGKKVAVPAKSSVATSVPLTLWKASVGIYSGKSQILVKDFDCTPGRGSIGDPTVTTNSGTPLELPETGSDTGSTFAKLMTIALAGITTYGAMYFIVNRRELSKK